jgi:hypothetical protein
LEDNMKKKLLSAVLAAALVALVGINVTSVSAAPATPQTWSLVAHFEYANGFSYDYVVATNLETSEVAARLQECGAGHRRGAGAVVKFYCYPVAE